MGMFGDDRNFLGDVAKAMLSSQLPPTQEEIVWLRLWLKADNEELGRLREAEERYETRWEKDQERFATANPVIAPTDKQWLSAEARFTAKITGIQEDIKAVRGRINAANARLSQGVQKEL